ncbi:MAG: ABC transporter ATP-binding protein [Acetobacteraceae bacterium]|nr:ABC transporter ATP-binding protein [Acetobacteraceae bacterium]
MPRSTRSRRCAVSSEPALEIAGIAKAFRTGDGVLEILRDASLLLAPGEMVALVAPSGAGKSTLLHIAGLLEGADRGRVVVSGQDASGAADSRRTLLRRERIGFVYQQHQLMMEFSALENVVLPQMIRGQGRRQAAARAGELLANLGLAARNNHRPQKLSGGEQQRVAIARALANRPAVILADEPTGNLDPDTADAVFNELLAAVRGEGAAALIATHNPALAMRCDRTVTLDHGRVVEVAR